MPLALLLQKTIKALNAGVKRIDTWNQLVLLEQLLIGRARSAFLVHWFGTPLPLHGAHLRVVISNLAALQSRYQAIRATSSQAGGPNLLKPLAGISGSLVGMALSPVAGIGVSIGILKIGVHNKNWLVSTLGLLNLITFGALIPILGIFGMAGGTSAALLIGSGAMSSEMTPDAYNLLGAAAQILLALKDLLGQLLGPRTALRNPLLGNFLALADKLAALLPLLLAGVALLITRIGSLLVPLASQFMLLYQVIQNMADLISEVIGDLMKHLDELTAAHSPFMLLVSAMNLVPALLKVIKKDTCALLDALDKEIRAALQRQWSWEPGLAGVLSGIIEWVRAQRDKHLPLGILLSERMREAGRLYGKRVEASIRQVFAQHSLTPALYEHLGIVHHLLEPPPSAPSKLALVFGTLTSPISGSKKSGGSGGGPPTFEIISALLGVPVPHMETLKKQAAEIDQAFVKSYLPLDSDTINKVADALDAQRERPGLHYTLSKEAWRAVVQAEQPVDVFKAERAREGKSLRQALRDEHHEEIQYRSMIFAVVHKVLSPYLDAYIAQLAHVFQMVDEQIYNMRKSAPKEDYPVLELQESSRLQPIIHRLRIHAEHAESADVRIWGNALKKALGVQQYIVPAET